MERSNLPTSFLEKYMKAYTSLEGENALPLETRTPQSGLTYSSDNAGLSYSPYFLNANYNVNNNTMGAEYGVRGGYGDMSRPDGRVNAELLMQQLYELEKFQKMQEEMKARINYATSLGERNTNLSLGAEFSNMNVPRFNLSYTKRF